VLNTHILSPSHDKFEVLLTGEESGCVDCWELLEDGNGGGAAIVSCFANYELAVRHWLGRTENVVVAGWKSEDKRRGLRRVASFRGYI